MEKNKEQKIVKFKGIKISIMIIVILISIIVGGYIIYDGIFVSTPAKTITEFYNDLQNNQIQAAMNETDIASKLNAIETDSKSREAVLFRINKQLNINDRKLYIKILSMKEVAKDANTATYEIQYKLTETYTNGLTSSNTSSDNISLTKIKGDWKIVGGNGMYTALQQIVNNVLSGDD